MDASRDYYGILGVLPKAEDVVIRAAYRALASRYHPDRFDGLPEEAHRRMTELNEAYAILSTPASRAEYDRLRASTAQENSYFFAQPASDAPPAFDPLAQEWSIALRFYPDLAGLESRLARISWRLVNLFRVSLLEAKTFERRGEVAEELEREFLEAYFGRNKEILEFAHLLIGRGEKEAARELNQVMRVLGSDVSASRIIETICANRQGLTVLFERKRIADEIVRDPVRLRLDLCERLIALLGGKMDVVHVNAPFLRNQGWLIEFMGKSEYVATSNLRQWVIDNVVPAIGSIQEGTTAPASQGGEPDLHSPRHQNEESGARASEPPEVAVKSAETAERPKVVANDANHAGETRGRVDSDGKLSTPIGVAALIFAGLMSLLIFSGGAPFGVVFFSTVGSTVGLMLFGVIPPYGASLAFRLSGRGMTDRAFRRIYLVSIVIIGSLSLFGKLISR